MGMIESHAMGAAAFFLVVLLSGVWLSRLGRPLNGLVVTLHNLLGLGAGIYLVVTLAQLVRAAALGTGAIVAAVVTGVSMAAAAATGALLGAAKPAPDLVLRLHQLTPLAAVAGATALFWLLL